MSKNIWIYVAGVLTIITTIILGLLIPHLSIPLYFVALGILVIAEFVFFLQMVIKRQFTDWLPINVVTAIWVLGQVCMMPLVQILPSFLFWIIEVLAIGLVAIIGSLTAADSHYRKGRAEDFSEKAEDVFKPKTGDY
ncbi:hypothetical protein [Streptococcus mitis]|uniref:Uncharacterized protein n=1 Tax=Streptococcus mitis TaxID=28037 RepID=A0A428E3E0_STRMT|nr:hypothetical protein [Streptococcus mitis]RSJ04662.1 hypothetical protein D8837_08675 [Streptococcus mitis]